MKFKTLALMAVVGFSTVGCAIPGVDAPSTPISIGDNTYLMKIESGPIGVSDKKVLLIQQAAAHCQGLGRKMERISSNQNRGGLIGDFVLDIEYKCVAK
jgi:hypothetical protein